MTRITGILHEYHYTFFKFYSAVLRMRIVSVKICKENQNIVFVFNNFLGGNRVFVK
jgi:hypothetical protein